MFRLTLKVVLVAAMLFSATHEVAIAGNFGVSPIDVQFSARTRSTSLTVSNDDTKPVSLRVRAMRWTQDASGADSYTETTDLVFFPKRLELKPGDQKVVRVGIEDASGGERAYRLYIEELPPTETPRDSGTRLAVLLSIGVPVFVSDSTAKPKLELRDPTFDKDGVLRFSVVNSGNSRARISRLLTTDGQVINEGLPSRYVFPGIAKEYRVKGAKDCPSKGIVIESDGEKLANALQVKCS